MVGAKLSDGVWMRLNGSWASRMPEAETAGSTAQVTVGIIHFFAEKYDCNWDEWREECLEMRNELLARQNTERIFRDGQANAVHPSDYFDYWNDYDPSKEDLYFKIDDWD